MKNKKTVITITSIVAVLLVIIGVTYAYWLVTKTQTNQNVISSGCLDISLSGEKNDIELQDQFPMSDEDGMKLTPYEFTVTNNCTTSVDYQVNLESIGDSSTSIIPEALKVALDDNIKLLSSGGYAEPTVSNAYESHSIAAGRLAASSDETTDDTVTYELRIWIDKDAPISEQNKSFRSKISVTIGQGIELPYEKGTLAYDILSNYGSANAIFEIDANELKHRIVKYPSEQFRIGTSASYWYGTDYSYDETQNKYTLTGNLVKATLTECRSGAKECGEYTLKNESATYSYRVMYKITDFKAAPIDYYETSKEAYVNELYVIQYSNSFDANSVGEEGLYKASDDYGDTYYFRGNVQNNYVQLGSWKENVPILITGCDFATDSYCVSGPYETLEACEAAVAAEETYSCKVRDFASENDLMYWRIVRINGDGTIRLIYDGTSAVENNESHIALTGMSLYNEGQDDVKYFGYTYDDGTGNQVDSIIKNTIDTWYEKNLKEAYKEIIADSIFCNDRSEFPDNTYYTGYSKRFNRNANPRLTCSNKDDRYTVNDTEKGNGYLSNPVGLLTADEAIMSGVSGLLLSGGSGYLYNNDIFWTLSPGAWYGEGDIYMFSISSGLSLNEEGFWVSTGVRPVINLKLDVPFTGSGTIDDPYVITAE